MSSSYELRLRLHVQDAIAVPVMSGSINQILRVQVSCAWVSGRTEIRVICHIKPYVAAAINKGQAWRFYVVATVSVECGHIRSGGGDGIEFARRERPVAPLLCVVHRQDSRYQRRFAHVLANLIDTYLRAGSVRIRAIAIVGDIGPERLVLGAEAAIISAVDTTSGTQRQVVVFGERRIVAQVDPWFTVGIV